MKKILFVLSILVAIIPQFAIAQDDKVVDVITLKDGQVLVGKFLNVNDTSYLFSIAAADSIHINKKNVVSINYNVEDYDIKEIRNDAIASDPTFQPKEKVYKTDGYFIMADLGAVSGREVHWHSTLTIGKRITPNLYIGIQGGKENVLRTSTIIWETDGIWAIGGYGRYYPLKTKLRPYLSARIGYGFVDNSYQSIKEGGINVLPGIGLHLPSSNGFHFLVSLHQYFQKTSGSTQFETNIMEFAEINHDLWLNRTVLKIAMEF